MPRPEKPTVRRPADQAGNIKSPMPSGTFASAEEVGRRGPRALQARDAPVERWLREDVVATHDAMHADPSRAIPADRGFAAVRARHADRVESRQREP
jgi:antitoxin ParD1/3/4